MKFKSRKDLLSSVILFGVLALVIGLTMVGINKGEMERDEQWTLIPIALVVGFVLWLFFGTNYKLEQNQLKYRSGPFYGRINIDSIREIVRGKTMYVGFKPATARNGLIIKYNKYDELYISPKTNEIFIEKILGINGKIKITV